MFVKELQMSSTFFLLQNKQNVPCQLACAKADFSDKWVTNFQIVLAKRLCQVIVLA